MSTQDRDDNTTYKVVVNHEDQYSIWPAERGTALGWRDAGKQGSIAGSVLRIIQRSKSQAVERGNRARAHCKNVAQDATDAGRCSLERLDKARVVV